MENIKANHIRIKYLADPNMHSEEDHRGAFPKIVKAKNFHKDNWTDAFEFALECSYLLTTANNIAFLLPKEAKGIVKYYFPDNTDNLRQFNKSARRSKLKYQMLKLYKQ